MVNKKHVFWQAFFLTILFFLIGLVLGVYLEQVRADNVNVSFYDSEVSLYDSFALGTLFENPNASCDKLREADIAFADKIYDEARQLEKFDDSSKLTDSVKSIHRKYDLLRTMLWINSMAVKEKCGNLDIVVYLYIYDTDDISIRSEQEVWGKILQELKGEKGGDIILIPIAVDSRVSSLDYLIDTHNVKKFPAVIINDKNVVYEIKTADELKSYL